MSNPNTNSIHRTCIVYIHESYSSPYIRFDMDIDDYSGGWFEYAHYVAHRDIFRMEYVAIYAMVLR